MNQQHGSAALPMLDRAGTYSGTIVSAGKRKAPNGHEFIRCRIETPRGWTTADLWLTAKARPWSIKRVEALGLGEDALGNPALLVGVACPVKVTGIQGEDGKTWWSGELPLPQFQDITPAERSELCSRVDLLSLLRADGVVVKPSGKKYVCSVRPGDKTPSCFVYPPGVGAKGAAGWTLHDYGDGWGGDALAYLVDKRGLPFIDALAELCRLTGRTPPSMEGLAPNGHVHESMRATHTIPPMPVPVASMASDAQAAAVAHFLSTLCLMYPEARAEGDTYLEGRGVLPRKYPPGIAYRLPADLCRPLAERLVAEPEAELMMRAGLLKPAADGKSVRLPWWDDVMLFTCRDPEAWPVYMVGRRLEWKAGDRCGKYINQKTVDGGAVRWPFNLPALYATARRLAGWTWKPSKEHVGDLLLVEGPTDALGAAALGWSAVALLTRPRASGPEDRGSGAVKMLEPHLPALRTLRRICVVPDADPGAKGAEGELLASRLVAWLRSAGCRGDVTTLTDLIPDVSSECKDLADVASMKGRAP